MFVTQKIKKEVGSVSEPTSFFFIYERRLNEDCLKRNKIVFCLHKNRLPAEKQGVGGRRQVVIVCFYANEDDIYSLVCPSDFFRLSKYFLPIGITAPVFNWISS